MILKIIFNYNNAIVVDNMRNRILFLILFSFTVFTSCNRSLTIETIELPEPDFKGVYQTCNKSGRTGLKFISKSSNDIIDDDVWLEKYSKGMPNYVTYTFTPGGNRATEEIKQMVPVVCNGLCRRSIDMFEEYNVVYYGTPYSSWDGKPFGVSPTLILITSPSMDEVISAIDFSKFSVDAFSKPEDAKYTDISVWEVQIENDILYACVSHSTYSESSSGYNAYLVAVDLRSQTLKWVTKPLTCNSSFVIYNDVIFTGYGFTKEKDYIYILDKETGDRISHVPLSKAPGYFSIIDNKLYVRTYSFDYTFQIVV